jgi:hypothetical protein
LTSQAQARIDDRPSRSVGELVATLNELTALGVASCR